MNLRYSILIRWSVEDDAFLVFLPEFGDGPRTHGSDYEEAARHGKEVLELLVDTYRERGWELPRPIQHSEDPPATLLSKVK